MSASDLSQTLKLSPVECSQAITGLARSKSKRAAFLWGQPGISKSAVSQQVANNLGIAFADVRLSQMDPTDLRGIPYQVRVGNVQGISWSAPLILPRDIDYEDVIEIDAIDTTVHFYNPLGVNGIYYCTAPKIEVTALDSELTAEVVPSADDRLDRFRVRIRNSIGGSVAGKLQVRVIGEVRVLVGLEEFNSAPPSVQAAAYQLILDKRLGEYEVPKGCYLMAMGNRDTDKGVTFKMPTPIMNRFIHLEMEVNSDQWLDWAIGEQLHAHIVGFIGAFPDELNKFTAATAARGFQTPRSWHFASDVMIENEHSVPEQVLTGLLTGSVGDGGGVKFMEFRRIAADLPKADEILSGRLKRLDTNKVDVSLAYALTTTLCYKLLEEVNEIKKDIHVRGGAQKLRDHPDFPAWSARADLFLGFIMDNFRPEIAIMGGKAALATHKLPFDTQKMANFQRFADQYKKFIL